MTLGLLGSGVGHFLLVWFPGSFIANKELPRYDFFLAGRHVECVAIRNLGAGKRLLVITHIHISLLVENGRKINRYISPSHLAD